MVISSFGSAVQAPAQLSLHDTLFVAVGLGFVSYLSRDRSNEQSLLESLLTISFRLYT